MAQPHDFAIAPAAPGSLLIHYHGVRIGRLRYGSVLAADGKRQATELRTLNGDKPVDSNRFRVQVGPKGAQTLVIEGHVQPVENRGFGITYQMPHPAGPSNLTFSLILDLDLRQALPQVGPEQVKQDAQGVTVQLAPTVALKLALSTAPQAVRVENGDSLAIQLDLPEKFLRGEAGNLQLYVMLPEGCQVVPDFGTRLQSQPVAEFPQRLRGDQSPVDLSFLNATDRPAGQHGFLAADGDSLRFSDGTSARFWGVNVVASALFRTPKALVEENAKRLAAFGFNLVRIHHHDSDWVRPNIFLPKANDTQTLNPDALAALDYWIHCLRNEGIYVWLDLEVGRKLRAGDDVPGWAELGLQDHSVNAFNFVNQRIEALMQQFADAYLRHRNPHTGLRYLDDPAIAAVLVTNENDLVKHGLGISDGKRLPYHGKRFADFAKAFAAKHQLPMAAVMEPWKGGEGALVMSALEAGFFDRAHKHLRQLGLQVPIAATNYWGWNPLYALPSLTHGDVVDAHSYGSEAELSQDPRYGANFLQWIAGAAVLGRPVTVTEWNTPLPTRDRHSHPLFMAGHAALQGWDAIMVYAYNQGVSFRYADPWSTGNDPAMMATMPHAALAYRRGDVSRAKKHYVLQLNRGDLYQTGQHLRPIDLRALRTLLPQSRVSIRLPDIPELDYQATNLGEEEVVTDLQRSYIAADQRKVTSDTGELTWEFGLSPRYAIQTERTEALTGFIGQKPQGLNVLQTALDQPHATVALSSLDGSPLSQSAHMLLSVVAQVRTDPHPQRTPEAVYLVQIVSGRIGLRSGKPKLNLYPLSAAGKRGSAQPSTLDAGIHWFTLPKQGGLFYEVHAP